MSADLKVEGEYLSGRDCWSVDVYRGDRHIGRFLFHRLMRETHSDQLTRFWEEVRSHASEWEAAHA